MDIYKFFNSTDVAEHCRSIGHRFNAVESAVMVSRSNSHSLAEKHAAYKEIIAGYPDMEIPKGNNHRYIPSFHKALDSLIAHENREAAVLSHNKNDANYEPYLLSCYIDVPVPFKRGDLVEVDAADWMGNVFVVKGICRELAEWGANSNRILRADLIDMTADVFYESDGAVNCESVHFYPNLCYCRRELTGEQRILKYVGLFMQEKLCICGLLKIQRYLELDASIMALKADHDLKYQLECLEDNLLQS